jgi:hypothetical protein
MFGLGLTIGIAWERNCISLSSGLIDAIFLNVVFKTLEDWLNWP